MTGIKIRVLKGLCRFEIFSQIKYRNMSPLYTTAPKKIVSVPDISAMNLINCRMKAVCLQKKFFYFVSVCVPHCSGTPDDRYLSNAVLGMWSSTFKVL